MALPTDEMMADPAFRKRLDDMMRDFKLVDTVKLPLAGFVMTDGRIETSIPTLHFRWSKAGVLQQRFNVMVGGAMFGRPDQAQWRDVPTEE
jgi:hypothetical protein